MKTKIFCGTVKFAALIIAFAALASCGAAGDGDTSSAGGAAVPNVRSESVSDGGGRKSGETSSVSDISEGRASESGGAASASDETSSASSKSAGSVGEQSNIKIIKTYTAGIPERDDVFERCTFYDSLSGKSMPYRLHVPKDFDPRKKYPVILFLHGAGEIGTDNEKHLKNFTQGFGFAGDILENALIVCPQTPSGWGIDEYEPYDRKGYLGVAKRILDDVAERYGGDRNRIYLTGLSLGSFAVWRLLDAYPGFFAAAVPVCGGNGYYTSQAIIDTPIWIFHGTADPTVSFAGSLETYNAVRNAGGSRIRFTELPGVGHNAWDYAYTDREMFSWMFSQNLQTHQSADYDYINAIEIVAGDTVVITEKDYTFSSFVLKSKNRYIELYLTDGAFERLKSLYLQNRDCVFGFVFEKTRIYDFKFTSIPEHNILRIEQTIGDDDFSSLYKVVQSCE